MKDNKITITLDSGKEVEMTILFTTHLDKYNKDYIFYYDESDENSEVYVSSFFENKSLENDNVEYALDGIDNETEWNDLNEVLNQYVDDLANGNCEDCNSKDCSSCDKYNA